MSRPATTRLKVNPPLGTLPVLQYCRPEDLQIDPTYQRSLENGTSQTLVRRIAQFWNWDLCQPLVVARRGDEFFVVDGQHRLAAAVLRRDIAQLPCVITAYATAADEAASFVQLNQQRRPLTALDLFRAALAAEDTDAVAIARLMTIAGLTLAPHSNFTAWKPGMVSNIGGIQKCFRINGEEATAAALRALASGFQGQVLRYGGTIFGGLARVCSAPAVREQVDHLAIVLAARSQVAWMEDIKLEKAATDAKWDLAAGVVIRKALEASAAAGAAVAATPRPTPVPAIEFAPVAPEDDGRRWCQQCDRRVTHTVAAMCRSRFCSLKVSA